MEFFALIFDFIVHIDRHLQMFVAEHGAWVYALLFLIVFTETGVVVFPLLPGDSLLFVAGTLCGLGLMNLSLTLVLLWSAAFLGDQCNYMIGRFFGTRILARGSDRFRHAYDRAHGFYERYGGITIILARFMPFLRTFAPFVAGVADMRRMTFTGYNLIGGGLWVVGVTCAGYFFGNIGWVKDNLEKIIWALIFVPGILAILGAWRERRKTVAAE